MLLLFTVKYKVIGIFIVVSQKKLPKPIDDKISFYNIIIDNKCISVCPKTVYNEGRQLSISILLQFRI